MTLVGQKNIFAIEWKFHSAVGTWIFAHLQYWGGGVPIGDWEDTVVFPSVVIDHQEHLNLMVEDTDSSVDCSNFSMEYLFSALHKCVLEELNISISDSRYDDKYKEQYFVFYCLAREAMETYLKNYEYSSYYSHLEFLRDNHGIVIDDLYGENTELAYWISTIFDVSSMGSCAIEDHSRLYFVRDVSKNQERLVWKNVYRHPDDVDCRYIPSELSDQTHEAVMPIGYFKETINEFVRVASDEIAELRHKAKDFNYDLFLVNLTKGREKKCKRLSIPND